MSAYNITKEELVGLDKWWNAANYLTACQLYLLDNPLLEKPLTRDMIKRKIVGHWGTCPGQNFIYTHLNRVIKEFDLEILCQGPDYEKVPLRTVDVNRPGLPLNGFFEHFENDMNYFKK